MIGKKMFYYLRVIPLLFMIMSTTGSAASDTHLLESKEPMVVHYSAEDTEQMTVQAGNIIHLESLRQSVVPPYLMLMPFIELPDFLHLDKHLALDEDGVHGTIFVLHVVAPGKATLTLGFRDMQTRTITHEKKIMCIASPQ